MSHYIEDIAELPAPQRAAAQQLLSHDTDPRAIQLAVSANVPDPIISYVAGVAPDVAHRIADGVVTRDREIADALAVRR